jgi:hypothetical protein
MDAGAVADGTDAVQMYRSRSDIARLISTMR